MYECPNCTANLRYDIERRKLFCDACESTVDPYSFHKEQDALESTEYEVTVFTCPQCGGEIISEDTTAATFCSYCGASTILSSRVSKERKPKYIIPFSQTKEHCKNAYKNLLRKAIFTPKELKDPENIEKFRGIYMPYWVYSYSKKGPVTLKGKKSHRSGDYIITKYYDVDAHMDTDCSGIAYDASSTFSDTLSSAIAPFNVESGTPFNPSFLSGFYADTNDVTDWLYENDAEALFRQSGCINTLQHKEVKKYGVQNMLPSLRNAMTPTDQSSALALFPVWFLSYRKNDRVVYAVVNGQTGKVAADLPVDIRKYLLITALIALPLFLLFNLFFTFIPRTMLIIAAVLALLCTLLVNLQHTRMLIRENSEDDKGMQYRKSTAWEVSDQMLPPEYQPEPEPDITKNGSSASKRKVLIMVAIFFGYVFLIMIFPTLGAMVFPIIWVSLLVYSIRSKMTKDTDAPIKIKMNSSQNTSVKKGFFKNLSEKKQTLAKPLIAFVLAVLIIILNPVEDLIYYIGAIVCLLGICWSISDILKLHNLLTTRKLPQLGKRGGDENA